MAGEMLERYVTDLEAALLRVEWDAIEERNGRAFCPACDRYKDDGHKRECWLGKLCAEILLGRYPEGAER